MDKVRFLFDEDVPAMLAEALHRHEPSIDILSVGDEKGPARKRGIWRFWSWRLLIPESLSPATRKRCQATWSSFTRSMIMLLVSS